MTKIAFIGAGSTVFAKNLLGDILSYPELAESTISLYDLDPERLRTTQIVAQRIADGLEHTRGSTQPSIAARRWRTPTTPLPCSRSPATSLAP